MGTTESKVNPNNKLFQWFKQNGFTEKESETLYKTFVCSAQITTIEDLYSFSEDLRFEKFISKKLSYPQAAKIRRLLKRQHENSNSGLNLNNTDKKPINKTDKHNCNEQENTNENTITTPTDKNINPLNTNNINNNSQTPTQTPSPTPTHSTNNNDDIDDEKISIATQLQCWQDNNPNFEFDNRTQLNVTRLNKQRPMIMGKFARRSHWQGKNKPNFHQSIRLIYFSKEERGEEMEYNCSIDDDNNIYRRPKLFVRVFCIHLKYNKIRKQKILRIEGPLINNFQIYNYQCKEYFFLENISINDIVKISRKKMHTFGEFDYVNNNCYTFSYQLMQSLKEKHFQLNKTKTFSTSMNVKHIDCQTVENYISEYFCDNYNYFGKENDNCNTLQLSKDKSISISMNNRSNDDNDSNYCHDHSQPELGSYTFASFGNGSDLNYTQFNLLHDSDCGDEKQEEKENENVKKKDKRIQIKSIPLSLIYIVNDKTFDLPNPNNIVYCGKLEKERTFLRGTWMNVYGVLKKDGFLYFYNDKSMKRIKEERLDITNAADKISLSKDNKKKFQIATFNVFKANSSDEREKWKYHITNLRNIRNKQLQDEITVFQTQKY